MPEYRFYRIGKNGHITSPPSDHILPDDHAAVREATLLIDGKDIEIWQGPRIVAYINSDGEQKKSG